MAVYNTPSDAANTAVRAFLTKVGEYYLGRSFNTGNGRGLADWERIRDQTFEKRCCYCDKPADKLQIEHLLMFNRTEFGLHHPGNIVPCCAPCNKRHRNSAKEYVGWEDHLRQVCQSQDLVQHFASRRAKILEHVKREGYPDLTQEERHAIRVIANALYENIKQESERSLSLYQELDKAFVKKE